jgi:hypothetical protein
MNGKTSMKISKAMLKGYIGSILNDWIIDNGIPPEAPDSYASYMKELRGILSYTSDLEAFQLGIEYLLNHPEIDITFLDSSEYIWTNDEIRPLLLYVKEQLWPNFSLESNYIELVNMPILEWRNLQSTL